MLSYGVLLLLVPWGTLGMTLVERNVEWVEYQPRHTHLALGEQPNILVVTWSTKHKTPNPVVILTKPEGNEVQYNGTSSLFVDEGKLKASQWIHRVEVTGLLGNTTYKYIVGSNLGWSVIFYTTTIPDGNKWPLRVALYGDLGNDNAMSLPFIQRETEEGYYDGIIHVGDFAYDLQSDNAKTGDLFMEQIEPIASMVPYMTCPGNHENYYNFSNYKARFNMPRDNKNMFYSFNMARVHFISINTESYFYLQYGIKQLIYQYNWLVEDLKQASTPEARAERPWIVIFGHRPMYCSGREDEKVPGDDCLQGRTRIGMPLFRWWGMEELMYKYGVDLAFWAHEHNYERMWPVYDMKVLNGTEGPYIDPPAPVHITTGSAGCSEIHDPFNPEQPEWTAFRSLDYGYTKMFVPNDTHLNIQQVSAEKEGEIQDEFWIVKNKHGSYQ